MKTSRSRRPHVLALAALILVAFPPLAQADGQKATTPIEKTVKSGDFVIVTPWSGGKKTTGEVVEANTCSLALRVGGRVVEIPTSTIKTLRRHQGRKVSPGARTMLEVADQCSDIGCAPAALAYIGVAAIFQGFDDLAHAPKVVYRGKRGPASEASCSKRAPAPLVVLPLRAIP